MLNMTVTFLDDREPVTFEGVYLYEAVGLLKIRARKVPPEYDKHQGVSEVIVQDWESYTVTKVENNDV